ncbi:2-hydroxyacyl-CoA dehydratase subunit D [Halalkalibacter krulwichiae]|uniref:2-hydroxyacyl-CoA dehydratase subunit D n=1 Tax=Halalkalibacter krulwichiae TaxID=199441 RepID=UPI000826D397|nr:2-hydroxyacyl-CoA dehydratase family protein [Halalkalibacter krulwichiae]
MSLERISAQNILEDISSVYHYPEQYVTNSNEEGKKRIGFLGNDVPVELLIAAGCIPVPVRGSRNKDPYLADEYLESGFEPRVKMQMGQIVNGIYRDLDYLIISNSSDAVIRVYYYLRALKLAEHDRKLPELYFFDFLHSKVRSATLYNLDRVQELVKELEQWCGHSITNQDLVNAIKLSNKTRRLLKRFSSLRGPEAAYVNGVQALQVISAAYLFPREEYNNLLEHFLEDIEQLKQIEGPRIFVTGSTHEHTEFYELVESNGAVIVGEDHDLSVRNFIGEMDTNVNPLEAIVDYYHLKRALPASQSTVSERVKSLVGNVSATSSDGVIFYIHHADDAPSWDFPEQKKALESMGIPVLLIDREQYRLVNKAEVDQKIKEFIKLLKSRGSKQ